MSNELQSVRLDLPEQALELLKQFTAPLAPVVAAPSESHLHEFAAVIENVIVPRLLVSHAKANKKLTDERVSLRNVAVADFIELTTGDDPDKAIDYVRHLLTSGVTFQEVLLELMAPAARILGERWEQDTASFVQVALGVARMHRILREFDGVPQQLWSDAGYGRQALLLPAPGEQHTFGLRLVQEFLLREGWTVKNTPLDHPEKLGEIVADEYYDVVGLSISGETVIEPFLESIRVVRKMSKNRHVKVIVGGQLFTVRPELVQTCGSDAYAADAPSTVTIVNRWARQLSGGT